MWCKHRDSMSTVPQHPLGKKWLGITGTRRAWSKGRQTGRRRGKWLVGGWAQGLASVVWCSPKPEQQPAEIQELGQKCGCSRLGRERHKCLQESGDQINVGVRRPRGCFQYLPAENEVRFKTLPSANQAAGQNRAEVPERIRKTSGLPSPLKLKSTTFNMTLRVCTIPSNMANVVMLPISAEGYLLQEASLTSQGLWDVAQNNYQTFLLHNPAHSCNQISTFI